MIESIIAKIHQLKQRKDTEKDNSQEFLDKIIYENEEELIVSCCGGRMIRVLNKKSKKPPVATNLLLEVLNRS